MDRGFSGPDTKIERFSHLFVWWWGLTWANADKGAQNLESRYLATCSALLSQTLDRPGQQGHRPTSVENFLGGQMICRFQLITIFGILCIESDKFKVPATFERTGTI